MKSKLLAIYFILTFFFSNLAAAEFLPYNLQAALMLKILNFDKNVDRSAVNGVITIGIVYEANKRSLECSKSILMELLSFKSRGMKIRNSTIDFCLIPFDENTFADTVKSKNAMILYVNVETPGSLAKIKEFTKKSGILTVAGLNSPEKVKSGITIGLELENEKPQILFNPDSAVKEGSNFPKEFLALVKVIQ
jgi:hypothetical protein